MRGLADKPHSYRSILLGLGGGARHDLLPLLAVQMLVVHLLDLPLGGRRTDRVRLGLAVAFFCFDAQVECQLARLLDIVHRTPVAGAKDTEKAQGDVDRARSAGTSHSTKRPSLVGSCTHYLSFCFLPARFSSNSGTIDSFVPILNSVRCFFAASLLSSEMTGGGGGELTRGTNWPEEMVRR